MNTALELLDALYEVCDEETKQQCQFYLNGFKHGTTRQTSKGEENNFMKSDVMLSLPLEFIEWKLKLMVRSSDVSGKWTHWFPNALSKQYNTHELYLFFMGQRGNGA